MPVTRTVVGVVMMAEMQVAAPPPRVSETRGKTRGDTRRFLPRVVTFASSIETRGTASFAAYRDTRKIHRILARGWACAASMPPLQGAIIRPAADKPTFGTACGKQRHANSALNPLPNPVIRRPISALKSGPRTTPCSTQNRTSKTTLSRPHPWHGNPTRKSHLMLTSKPLD